MESLGFAPKDNAKRLRELYYPHFTRAMDERPNPQIPQNERVMDSEKEIPIKPVFKKVNTSGSLKHACFKSDAML